MRRARILHRKSQPWERDLPEAFPPTILKGAVSREKDDGAHTWGKPGGGSKGSVERDG